MNCLDGEVLVSCSDDQYIAIYNPIKNFEFVKELCTTNLVNDWHTITYLCLEEVKFFYIEW